MSHAEPNIVFKRFQDGLDHALQISIPIERRLKFMFLVVAHRLHLPSITRSLTGNSADSYRDPDTILRECKDALSRHLLNQLKRVLHHHDSTKFLVHVTEEQHR